MQTSIKRCIISLKSLDDKDLRVQQVSYNGKADTAEVYAPYGMSYNVPPDSLSLYGAIGGDEGNLVTFPDRPQDRIRNLKETEVAFFNPITKTSTIYKQNGDLVITTNGENGDFLVTVKKDHTIEIGNDCVINVGNNVTINAAGNLNLNSDSDINITASGNVNISGSAINLN